MDWRESFQKYDELAGLSKGDRILVLDGQDRPVPATIDSNVRQEPLWASGVSWCWVRYDSGERYIIEHPMFVSVIERIEK